MNQRKNGAYRALSLGLRTCNIITMHNDTNRANTGNALFLSTLSLHLTNHCVKDGLTNLVSSLTHFRSFHITDCSKDTKSYKRRQKTWRLHSEASSLSIIQQGLAQKWPLCTEWRKMVKAIDLLRKRVKKKKWPEVLTNTATNYTTLNSSHR